MNVWQKVAVFAALLIYSVGLALSYKAQGLGSELFGIVVTIAGIFIFVENIA